MADAPETLDMEVLCMQMIVDAGSAKSDYMEALQAVKAGDILVVLEAMKMENEILAPRDGTVAQVVTTKGAVVDTGAPLVVLA